MLPTQRRQENCCCATWNRVCSPVANFPYDFERGAVVRAERCESYLAIDLARLRRWKSLRPGRSSSISWSRGSVGIVAGDDCVHLIYRHRVARYPVSEVSESWLHYRRE